jgi:hypothetical protein
MCGRRLNGARWNFAAGRMDEAKMAYEAVMRLTKPVTASAVSGSRTGVSVGRARGVCGDRARSAGIE